MSESYIKISESDQSTYHSKVFHYLIEIKDRNIYSFVDFKKTDSLEKDLLAMKKACEELLIKCRKARSSHNPEKTEHKYRIVDRNFQYDVQLFDSKTNKYYNLIHKNSFVEAEEFLNEIIDGKRDYQGEKVVLEVSVEL